MRHVSWFFSGSVTSLRVLAPAGVAIFVDGRHAGLRPTLVVPIGPAHKAQVEVMAVIGGHMVKRMVDVHSTREIVLEARGP